MPGGQVPGGQAPGGRVPDLFSLINPVRVPWRTSARRTSTRRTSASPFLMLPKSWGNLSSWHLSGLAPVLLALVRPGTCPPGTCPPGTCPPGTCPPWHLSSGHLSSWHLSAGHLSRGNLSPSRIKILLKMTRLNPFSPGVCTVHFAFLCLQAF